MCCLSNAYVLGTDEILSATVVEHRSNAIIRAQVSSRLLAWLTIRTLFVLRTMLEHKCEYVCVTAVNKLRAPKLSC